MTTLGILASGRGSNCEAILGAIAAGALDARVGVVLTDRPGAGVLDRAASFHVSARYLDPRRRGGRLAEEAEREYVEALREAEVEWVVLAGFMRILGPTLLDAFPERIVNIHPSLLPAFPGLDAQGQALRYGVRVAGATVHLVDAGVDTGPIVSQRAIDVRDDDTEESLSRRILEVEHALYVEALQLLVSGGFRIDGRRLTRRLR